MIPFIFQSETTGDGLKCFRKKLVLNLQTREY
jgi:hypothetical protein